MTRNWMKVEHETPDKPEILAIAAKLDIDPDDAFGKCFRLWRWFDQHTENGNAVDVTFALLNRYLGVTYLCETLESVGWLFVSDEGISLPNFDRHNGVTAKTRALTARRVKTYKSKNTKKKGYAKGNAKGNARGVTPSSLFFSSLLDSPIRESITKEMMESNEFQEAWDSWIKARMEKKTTPTMEAARLTIIDLKKKGIERSVKALLHSAKNNWKGVFEPKPDETEEKPSRSRVPTQQELDNWNPQG